MSSSSASAKSILSGLGKATRRGVRRCPKCGTINGTRGLSCKNRNCDMIFKEGAKALSGNNCGVAGLGSKVSAITPAERVARVIETCRLITGGDRLLYSVRWSDPSPAAATDGNLSASRGLVLLASSATAATTETAAHSATQPSRCFVPGCIGRDPRSGQNYCPHVSACMGLESPEPYLTTDAQALRVKHSVLNQLPISSDLKHEIWLGARCNGPLVQRVSTAAMVVKCSPDERHPIGYLHVYFDNNKDSGVVRMYCECDRDPAAVSPCIHFFSCIAVFASDERLSAEFSNFIECVNSLPEAVVNDVGRLREAGNQRVIKILGQDENGETIEVEVLDEDGQLNMLADEATKSLVEVDGNLQIEMEEQHDDEESRRSNGECHSGKDNSSLTGNMGTHLEEGGKTQEAKVSSSPSKRKRRRVNPPSMPMRPPTEPIDETKVELSFISWLSSVTERVNQTMHYQFTGSPEPLVFHAPQTFFDCLWERMSRTTSAKVDGKTVVVVQKKKRLPTSTTVFERRDAPPKGVFTKYSWNIANLMQVKQILDTPSVRLDISRAFVDRDSDENYELIDETADENSGRNNHQTKATKRKAFRPYSICRTFLKVGAVTGSKPAYAFVIEWIPDVLPTMAVGELRIIFRYGHQRDGQPGVW